MVLCRVVDSLVWTHNSGGINNDVFCVPSIMHLLNFEFQNYILFNNFVLKRGEWPELMGYSNLQQEL